MSQRSAKLIAELAAREVARREHNQKCFSKVFYEWLDDPLTEVARMEGAVRNQYRLALPTEGISESLIKDCIAAARSEQVTAIRTEELVVFFDPFVHKYLSDTTDTGEVAQIRDEIYEPIDEIWSLLNKHSTALLKNDALLNETIQRLNALINYANTQVARQKK